MAASSPLHSDGSASRQPSSHSLHGITASNAALPSRKVEGLLDHLRPWSGSLSCGAPPRPRPLPFARASHADARTKTTACARAVRVRCCPRICQATTMRRTAGIKNNIGTRVERREKGSDPVPPYHRYISPHATRETEGVSDTPDHSNDIYLPSSSLIGDADTVAWQRAARCTGTRPHRASLAAIVCTASLHRTPPFQAAKSKAFLVLSGRGAAVALVALRRDLCPSHLSTPCALILGP